MIADSANQAKVPLVVRVVINTLGEGGTERSMAELTPLLAEHGVEIRYAILRSRGDEGVETLLRKEGVAVDVLPPGRSRYSALRRIVRAERPDVVHTMLFEANITARLALIGVRVPLLTSIVSQTYSAAHRMASGVPIWKQRVVQCVDLVSAWVAVDHFHAVSQAAAKNAQEQLLIPRRDLTVVGRGRADPALENLDEVRRQTRSELGIPQSAKVVVTLGRQEPPKDLVTLIDAMVGPLSRGECWLLLVGRRGTASAAVEAALAALPDRSHVLELGHRSDVPKLLAASDLFVMTSLFEGMPGAVIEAMAMGLPVVASDITSVREVVEVDESALVAQPGNVDDFNRQIERLLHDGDLAERLGRCGRQIFLARFEIEMVADAMGELYRSVSRNPDPRDLCA